MINLLIITILLVILDIFWFSYSLPIYEKTFLSVQGSPLKMRISGGLFAWFLIALGIRYLVNKATIGTAFIQGALLGFIIYGVYNGTNYATLTNYPINTAVIDTLWGTAAVATVSVISTMF